MPSPNPRQRLAEFAEATREKREEIDRHGCDNPPTCPQCSIKLYEIGLEGIRLGVIEPRIPKERFQNLPATLDAETISEAMSADPRAQN